ncbi:MAG TPA: DUF2726 domain-containing protein [Methylibium sp.]
MSSLVVLLAALIVLGLVWMVVRGRKAANQASGKSKPKTMDAVDTVTGWPPDATRLMTTEERRAYILLRQALPNHMILAQVPLARFIKVPTRNSYAEWMRRAGQLCADMLVCDASSKVIAVIDVRRPEIEESDRGHKRHARMDRVLKAAGIQVMVWREDRLPAVSAVREQFLKIQQPAQASAAAGGTKPGMPTKPSDLAPTLDAEVDDDTPQQDPPPSTWYDDLESAPMPLSAQSVTSKHWGR